MSKDHSIRVDMDVWKKVERLAKETGCWKKSIIRRAVEKMEKEK